jgi:hypothetical protein
MPRHRTLTLWILFSALIIALAGAWPGSRPVALAANPDIGFVDFKFSSSAGSDPTADKPQSKLWHNDGYWWAVMIADGASSWHIFRLDWPDQWVDTGVAVDERPTSRADVLWDGSKLYIASLVRFNSVNQGRLYRYSYNPNANTYSLDSGFPTTIMSGSAEAMAFDKDSAGRLWITYTQANKVYVNSSTTSDAAWGTPFVVPGAAGIGSDDISSLVAYRDSSGPSIGVLWSSHTSTSAPAYMYFAYHRDSDAPNVWQPVEQIYGGSGTCLADDHINLKSLQADPSGAIFAALKTSTSDSGSCTGGKDLIRLVVRYPNNTWKWTTFGAASDQHTRPIVLLDSSNRQVYMFATAPTSCGVIYYKKTGMDNPSFPTGKGTPFISSSTYTCINNATTTKQTVDAGTGLVVLASDESKRFYVHNAIELGAPYPRLNFSANPSGAEVGLAFNTQPVVFAYKAPNQLDTNFNGFVSLAIKAGTGANGATLGGVATVRAVNGVANFSGLSINTVGAGYRLTATAGTVGWSPTDSTSFSVNKRSQAISFGALTDRSYSAPPFTVRASATSGLGVTFSAEGDCTIAGSTVTITSVGRCDVTASQVGNAIYEAASPVTQSFQVEKASQTITFFPLPPRGYGEKVLQLSAYALASSGLPISFSAGGSCRISNDRLLITGYDTCIVVAGQGGNQNYDNAPQVFQTFTPSHTAYVPLARRR